MARCPRHLPQHQRRGRQCSCRRRTPAATPRKDGLWARLAAKVRGVPARPPAPVVPAPPEAWWTSSSPLSAAWPEERTPQGVEARHDDVVIEDELDAAAAQATAVTTAEREAVEELQFPERREAELALAAREHLAARRRAGDRSPLTAEEVAEANRAAFADRVAADDAARLPEQDVGDLLAGLDTEEQDEQLARAAALVLPRHIRRREDGRRLGRLDVGALRGDVVKAVADELR